MTRSPNRPPPVAPMVELGLEPRHGRIALLAGKQVAQVLANLGIGVTCRPLIMSFTRNEPHPTDFA
ncbi:hypothetical protein GCM10022403_084530 [Streptomyces coacervatus]|uniref:Uncharacterized protein n=1 Tax=Streptomyces coacervatus TaxID=647381 RepID=A0ABP7JBV3_9ACTN